jgi:hypothetical protein
MNNVIQFLGAIFFVTIAIFVFFIGWLTMLDKVKQWYEVRRERKQRRV